MLYCYSIISCFVVVHSVFLLIRDVFNKTLLCLLLECLHLFLEHRIWAKIAHLKNIIGPVDKILYSTTGTHFPTYFFAFKIKLLLCTCSSEHRLLKEAGIDWQRQKEKTPLFLSINNYTFQLFLTE